MGEGQGRCHLMISLDDEASVHLMRGQTHPVPRLLELLAESDERLNIALRTDDHDYDIHPGHLVSFVLPRCLIAKLVLIRKP